MSDTEYDGAVRAAAKYLRKQHRGDAVLEAKVGRRHADLVGNKATVDAFDAMLAYLGNRPRVG
ncbi:hypothetical protein [Aureimonas sp. Leaf454]|uniref:hypothetical protein n=1 Tax=Aureimonas sp. Leaf454 TaxID=1736381 RepID=UPI0012E3AB88|nr:hypothetical protein [Aureimonas sp. Leaf454]